MNLSIINQLINGQFNFKYRSRPSVNSRPIDDNFSNRGHPVPVIHELTIDLFSVSHDSFTSDPLGIDHQSPLINRSFPDVGQLLDFQLSTSKNRLFSNIDSRPFQRLMVGYISIIAKLSVDNRLQVVNSLRLSPPPTHTYASSHWALIIDK